MITPPAVTYRDTARTVTATATAPEHLEDRARGRLALALAATARAHGLSLTADPTMESAPHPTRRGHVIITGSLPAAATHPYA